MKTVYFKSIMNPHGVNKGLVPKGYKIKHFSIVDDPLFLSHDIIEHPNGYDSMGTYCDELRALGAAIMSNSRSVDDIAAIIALCLRQMDTEFDEPVPYELDDVPCDLDSFFDTLVDKVKNDYRKHYDWRNFRGVEDIKYFLKDGYLSVMNKFGGSVIELKKYRSKVISDSMPYFDGLVAGKYFKIQYDFKDFSFDEITEKEYEIA